MSIIVRSVAPPLSRSLRQGGKKSRRAAHVSRFSNRGILRTDNCELRTDLHPRELTTKRRGELAGAPPVPRSLRQGGKKTPRQRELTTKRRGELAELAFTYKAATMGFGVAKPYGDSERYDFVLDAGGRFVRVQVKSSTTLLNGLYHINCHRRTGGRAVPYSPSEIDFLVAYIIPEDAWFILPITVVAHRTSLLFNPKGYPRGDGLFGAYREAWHLLREFR